MSHKTRPISPLRQRMLEDMALRKLAPKTQSHYIRAVINLTRFLGRSPDTASPEDLRPISCTWSRPGPPYHAQPYDHGIAGLLPGHTGLP